MERKKISQRQALRQRAELNRARRKLESLRNSLEWAYGTWVASVDIHDVAFGAVRAALALNHYVVVKKTDDGNKLHLRAMPLPEL